MSRARSTTRAGSAATWILAAVVSACGAAPGPVVADASALLPAPDATDATDAVDATEAAMDVARRCATDRDCAGDPGGGACEPASGRCVPCVPAADRCPPARHCDARTFTCVEGCRGDDGCAGGGPDGGPARRRCDTASHACVECLDDAGCAPGSLCVAGACAPGCSATQPCPPGQACCDGACADVFGDVSHCGACGLRCTPRNAAPACRNGVCAVAACTAPWADCDRSAADGCEADLASDPAHCGACGRACPERPRATTRCAAGRCEPRCDAGWADCNGDEGDGCETDLGFDPAHCGRCGARCTPTNASGACTRGECTIGACATGHADCDLNAVNGCETDTRASVAACGACGRACPVRRHALPGCVEGACVFACLAGYFDCDGDEANGCEADLRVDPDHCGGCARACALPHATAACAAARCRVGTCALGWGDCDATAANGCEADLGADPRHCGGCGRVCPPETRCEAGACVE